MNARPILTALTVALALAVCWTAWDPLAGQSQNVQAPLFEFDPIFNSIADASARKRLICRFDIGLTEPDWALGYSFDIVLGGREATPTEEPHDE